MIAADECNSLPQGTPKRVLLTGSYLAQKSGPHFLTILNFRSLVPNPDVRNYIDNVALAPVSTDLAVDEPNIPIASGGARTLSLDATPGHGGEVYLLLASFGSHPGFDIDGVTVPLNADALFDHSMKNANSSLFGNSFGTLDASGKAQATFDTGGAVNPLFLGRTITFAYVLLTAPGTRPVTYASYPVIVNFVP